MMEPHGAEAVGHPGLFCGFPINTALDYKGEGAPFEARSHGNDIVPLSYRSDFWNRKVDSGPLSYQFWDLFTRVRYGTVP